MPIIKHNNNNLVPEIIALIIFGFNWGFRYEHAVIGVKKLLWNVRNQRRWRMMPWRWKPQYVQEQSAFFPSVPLYIPIIIRSILSVLLQSDPFGQVTCRDLKKKSKILSSRMEQNVVCECVWVGVCLNLLSFARLSISSNFYTDRNREVPLMHPAGDSAVCATSIPRV